MRATRFTKEAATALRRHRNRAEQILAKIDEYAADPSSHANNVTALRGSPHLRLRVGDFRVIFEENPGELIILAIGPRGSVYD